MASWILALGGGALIGLAAALLMLSSGRIAGISGIVGGALTGDRAPWRWAFLAGLVGTGVLLAFIAPDAMAGPSNRGMIAVVAAGLIVGVGTRMGYGCTSGHGVCGLARFSKRSLVATVTFMGAGVITVTVLRVIGGAS